MLCVCFINDSIRWSAESVWTTSSQDQELKQPSIDPSVFHLLTSL